MLRRAASLIASGLLLHLNALGADRACAEHDGPPTHAPAHQHQGHDEDAERQSCDTPASAQCCDALSSCTLTFALDTERASPAPLSPAPRVAGGGSMAPAALLRAPDPPPPKA